MPKANYNTESENFSQKKEPKKSQQPKEKIAGMDYSKRKEDKKVTKTKEKGWNQSTNKVSKRESSRDKLSKNKQVKKEYSDLPVNNPVPDTKVDRRRGDFAGGTASSNRRKSLTHQDKRSKPNRTSLRDKMNEHIQHGKQIETDPQFFKKNRNMQMNQNMDPNQFGGPMDPNCYQQQVQLNSDLERFNKKLEREMQEQNLMGQMSPDQQEDYLSNQLMQLRQFDLQKNVLINKMNINNQYGHTDDFINRYNNNYRPANDLNKILTESEIEQSLDRIDD